MKTRQKIQSEVAKEHGWDSYEIVLEYFHEGIISKHAFLDIMDDVIHEVARQALINASENALIKYNEHFGTRTIDKQSILNESNIPVL